MLEHATASPIVSALNTMHMLMYPIFAGEKSLSCFDGECWNAVAASSSKLQLFLAPGSNIRPRELISNMGCMAA